VTAALPTTIRKSCQHGDAREYARRDDRRG
jgi:hypothetical protein